MASPLRLIAQPVGRRPAPADGDKHRDDTTSRPDLRIVPVRRRAASLAVFVMLLVSAAMILAVLLHTRIAERQLEIDELNRSVRHTQEAFDNLRAQRAELRSPGNLSAAATELGMVPGAESQFLHVDPMVLARTIAATGQLPNEFTLDVGVTGAQDPLDQFRLVKEVASEAP